MTYTVFPNSIQGLQVNEGELTMSQPTSIWWVPCVGNENSIAALQDVAIGGNVILNSADKSTPGTFTYNKMIRSIIFTSPDDLTGVTFVISGIGSEVDIDGNPTHILSPITEEIVGADGGIGDIAQSFNIYSKITSILITTTPLSPPVPATNLIVGFGQFGITDYVFFGYSRIAAPLSAFSLQFVDRDSIESRVYYSLNKAEYPDISQGGVLVPFGTENGEYITFIPGFQPTQTGSPPVDPYTQNTAMQVLGAITIIWATIKETSLNNKDSLYFTFLQPGISS